MVDRAKNRENWAYYLRIDKNKTELLSFFTGVLHDSFQLADKELVITKEDGVSGKLPLLDTEILVPCNHEDNSHMILHSTHAANNSHKKISIRTIDIDAVSIAVSVECTPEKKVKVYLTFLLLGSPWES